MSGLFQNLAYLVTKSRPIIMEMLRLRGYDVSSVESLPDEIHQMIANDMCDFEVSKGVEGDDVKDDDKSGKEDAGEQKAGEQDDEEQEAGEQNAGEQDAGEQDDGKGGKDIGGKTGDKGSIYQAVKAFVHYHNQKNSSTSMTNYVHSIIGDRDSGEPGKIGDLDSSRVEIIYLVKDKPTDTLIKHGYELGRRYHTYIQVFWIQTLLFNILDHVYVPKHTIISQEEIKLLQERYRLESRYQLPVILKDDPVAKFIGMRSGQVCRIERTSETAGVYHTYRCCK